jgi:hypothetical protein
MAGYGVAVAVLDRLEVEGSISEPTRKVRDPEGREHRAIETSGLGGKARVADLRPGRLSVGVRAMYSTADRHAGVVQDERLRAWDVAVPVELYPSGAGPGDYRWGLYAGPRLLVQSFEDLRRGEGGQNGTVYGLLFGSAIRLRYVALTLEANLARTASMLAGTSSRWVLLPMFSGRAIIPLWH